MLWKIMATSALLLILCLRLDRHNISSKDTPVSIAVIGSLSFLSLLVTIVIAIWTYL